MPRIRSRRTPVVEWSARALLLALLLLWIWLVLAEITEGTDGAWMYILALLAPLTVLVLAALNLPRLGGLIVVALAFGVAFFFEHPGPWLLLATPAVIAGALALTSRPARSAPTS